MLDIDETLMMTKHQPALLLSSYGVRMFEAYVRKSFTDFATKNRLLRQLERALKDKVLVESDTADVVHKLQESGCWVFGVTARYPELATNTKNTLLSLGIDLQASAPFPATVIKDPLTSAVFSDGIIYCGRESKAFVVSRFLQNVVFAQLLARAQAQARAEEEEQRKREELGLDTETQSESEGGLGLINTPAQRNSSRHMYTPATTSSSAARASPSDMVSVAESPSSCSSAPPSPTSSASSATCTPTPNGSAADFNTPRPPGLPTSRGLITPVPVDLPRHRYPQGLATPASVTSNIQHPNTDADTDADAETVASTLPLPPLARSVSSPEVSSLPDVAETSNHTDDGESHGATPSTLYRSASVARALATPLYSATRSAARQRFRRVTSRIHTYGSDHEGSSSYTPASRRALAAHTSSSTVSATPSSSSTISKRSRLSSKVGVSSRAAPYRRRRKVKVRVPRSSLPPEVVFVDNEVRHVTEMQRGLTIAKKLKIPIRCYCFAPETESEMQMRLEEEARQQQREAEQQMQQIQAEEEQQQQQQVQDQDDALLQHQQKEAVEALNDDGDARQQHLASSTASTERESSTGSSEEDTWIAAGKGGKRSSAATSSAASIASALSLASLGTPAFSRTSSAATVSPSSTLHLNDASSLPPSSGGVGIYGFMHALGNVAPSSAVVTSSSSSSQPTPPPPPGGHGGMRQHGRGRGGAMGRLATRQTLPTFNPYEALLREQDEESEELDEAQQTDLEKQAAADAAAVAAEQNAKLYGQGEESDHDESVHAPTHQSPPLNHNSNPSLPLSTPELPPPVSLPPSLSHPSSPLHNAHPSPQSQQSDTSDVDADTNDGGSGDSGQAVNDEDDGSELDGDGDGDGDGVDIDGSCTEDPDGTDGTTEYTDETQTETADDTGTETETGGRSLRPSILSGGVNRIGSSSSSSFLPSSLRPPMLMSALPKMTRPLEDPALVGLSPTETQEIAAAALGADSTAVLQEQMEVFAREGIILTNKEALQKVQSKKPQPPPQPSSNGT